MSGENEETATGSGRGGPMGTPSVDPDEASPSQDQESNAVVSGGGLVGGQPGMLRGSWP